MMDMHREKVIAKYEADCARLANEPWLIDSLTADRDRLAAENAELRKTVIEMQQACDEFSDELSQMYQLQLEAKCHGDLEQSHRIMVQVVEELTAAEAAANATLDALRDAIRRQGATLFYVTAAKELGVGFDAKPAETTDEPD